ncbi:phage holin [Enterococcus devriesei]|uniref:Phage phi LC3 family holin n=1 Tax=Enterococcus devriesei TaxID=319970 RepID=A0A1L8SH22_9ENTE|nr:phage holin [Enterococcus devriesei]OJG31281.1 phage phi LC3 family holin [Enterococcus devriesei]
MKINWKLRIKSKAFWIGVVPLAILLIQAVSAAFGYTLDLSSYGDKALAVINALFALLAFLGITADPTTSGLSDSERALTYSKPKKEEK